MSVLLALAQRVAAALIAVALVRAVEHRQAIHETVRRRIRRISPRPADPSRPSCPVCGSPRGTLGTMNLYFVCADCQTERWWTPRHRHFQEEGLTLADAMRASPWAKFHPEYARVMGEES